jgi:hypothetical protein
MAYEGSWRAHNNCPFLSFFLSITDVASAFIESDFRHLLKSIFVLFIRGPQRPIMSIPSQLFPHLFGSLSLSALLFWLGLTAPRGRQLYAALVFLTGNVCCFVLSFVMHQRAAAHGTVSRHLLRLD